MRALRTTMIGRKLGGQEIHSIVRDCDVVDTLESIRTAPFREAFLASDIAEIPDSSDAFTASTLMMQRRTPEMIRDELNMAMLYWWVLDHYGRIRKAGLVYMDKPAPLSVEQITDVFQQLAAREDYRPEITIVSHDHEGQPVRLVEGRVEA